MVNDSVMVKHRWKGGIHATHNNAVESGVSFCTGHLHSAKVTPGLITRGLGTGLTVARSLSRLATSSCMPRTARAIGGGFRGAKHC
jgi:hypothetical protein